MVPGLPHIPDLRVDSFLRPVAHLEVHVTHPHPGGGARLDAWGSSPTAFVAAAWGRRLARDYGGGVPPDASFLLVPAVVSSFGAWHPDFLLWLRRLLRDRAAASAHDDMEANVFLGSMLWRVGASLSVAVQRARQRAVFQGIARCVPELWTGAGRLGNPLSEPPELWRATPDVECVDWVAQELGLSPGRWDRPLQVRAHSG